MIKKSLVAFLVLFISYNLFLTVLPVGLGAEITVSDFQSNLTKSEVYLHDVTDTENKIVLAGSSITNRIKEQYFSTNAFNLGLDAQSAYNALNIIKKKKALPKVIMIEVNRLFRTESKEFQDLLLEPENYYTAKYIPSSRNINKPLILFRRLLYSFSKLILGTPEPIEQTGYVFPKDGKHPYLKQCATEVAPKRLDEAFDLLRSYVNYFEKEGVTILFYEAPVHEQTCKSKRLLQLRKTVKEQFPEKTYLEQPDCSNYRTFDIIHLTEASGIKYALYLKELGIKF